MATTLATSKYLYVGLNAGEWGGGLHRIDRATGKAVEIRSGKGCDALLDPQCTPVTGLAALPKRPDCIVGAVGLQHMFSHGRILKVCGDSVRQLYSHTYQAPPAPERFIALSDPDETVAFFGLTAVRDQLWAVAIDGIHKIQPDGSATVDPLPSFQGIGHVSVSFALPEIALVMTDVNARRSLSGRVPLLVPRQAAAP